MTKTAMPPLPAVTFDVGDQVEVATFFWRELRRRHGTIVGAEGEIWFFNGKCWEAFKTHELRALVHSYSGMLAGPVSRPYRLHVGAGFITGVLDCLADKVEDPEFFEETAPGVCCQNGFVSIDDDGTAKLVPHSPKQRHRFVMGGSWEPGKRPTGKLLETLLDGCFKDDPEAEEKKRCLRQLAGCVIMGRGTKLTSPKAFVLHGPGADNGKSQFLEMLKALVPSDASAALSMDGLCNPYFTPQLAGKLLNVSAEDPNVTLTNVGNFKKAVTGDLIDGREVRRRRVQFRPVAQHVFAANRLSTFRSGMDEGVKRRLLIIEFLRKIPKDEQIAELGARIAAEEPDALLDFAVGGACDLTRIGGFVAPDSSDRALGEWAETANPVAEFVKSYFVRTESHVRLDDAYKAFRTWAVEEAGIAEKDTPHRGEFGERVSEQLGRPRTYVTGGFKGWRGIMLTWRVGRKLLKKKDQLSRS